MNEYFFIKHKRLLHKVVVKDIRYVKSDGNYCEVVTDKRLVVKLSLVRLSSWLPDDKFIRAHQRYIVNFDKIDNINLLNNEIYLGVDVIPLGPKFKEDLLNRIQSLLP